MRLPKIFSCTVAGWLGLAGMAEAGVNWSIGIGVGVPYYRPYCRPYYYGYGPYPYYYGPAPYLVAPAPIYAGPPPIVVASPEPPPPPPRAVPALPAPQPIPNLEPAGSVSQAGPFEQYLQRLSDKDERMRLDAVIQLGRLKSERAIDPLAASLSGDRSPAVREAAAKALALIGSRKALPALTYSAKVDTDATVRSTSQFAAEILQGR